jgi:1,5-anhydro-D-fructose reductase (1,5-anhydro-D-mannitol-forming)
MPIRWGIVGCGDVCEVKSGPGFQKARDSELVAVMRRNPQLAEDFARRHGVPRWYDDADRLIADPEVDAVYVATPPGSHCEYARKVAAAGKPCLMEKPMARNRRECDEMIGLFESAGQKVFVAYYRRSQDRFQKVRGLLAELGPLKTVSYRHAQRPLPADDSGDLPWRVEAEPAGGGLVMDVGCHALDMIDFLFGPLAEVSGNATNRGGQYAVEDFVDIAWQHDGGITGSAEFDFQADAPADKLMVTGEGVSLSVPIFDPGPIVLQRRDEAATEIGYEQPEHVHQPFIQDVVDELTGRGTCPGSAGSARRTSVVLDVVLNDYYGDRQDEFWQAPDRWPGRSRHG